MAGLMSAGQDRNKRAPATTFGLVWLGCGVGCCTGDETKVKRVRRRKAGKKARTGTGLSLVVGKDEETNGGKLACEEGRERQRYDDSNLGFGLGDWGGHGLEEGGGTGSEVIYKYRQEAAEVRPGQASSVQFRSDSSPPSSHLKSDQVLSNPPFTIHRVHLVLCRYVLERALDHPSHPSPPYLDSVPENPELTVQWTRTHKRDPKKNEKSGHRWGAAGNGTWPGRAAWTCGKLPTGHVSHGCTGWLVSFAPATDVPPRTEGPNVAAVAQGEPLRTLPGNRGSDPIPCSQLVLPSTIDAR